MIFEIRFFPCRETALRRVRFQLIRVVANNVTLEELITVSYVHKFSAHWPPERCRVLEKGANWGQVRA